MNVKRKIIWLLIVAMLLASCSGKQDDGGDTPTSSSLSTSVSPPASSMTAETRPEMAMEPERPTNNMAATTETAAEPNPAEESEESGGSGFSIAGLLGLSDEKKAIRILSNEPIVAEFLEGYPDWNGETWPEDEENDIWGVDFYSEAADEWLGWGMVNVNTGEILDYFVPRDLSPEEFQAGLATVEKLVLNDAGVQARLGDPDLWEHETYFNRWDQIWEVWFWHGLDELAVTVYLDEENAYLEEIFDPSQLEAEKEAEWQRDQAIELAWGGEGIDQALDGVDNWHTLVAPQGDLWAVSFIADDQELFFALVDIENQTIIETK